MTATWTERQAARGAARADRRRLFYGARIEAATSPANRVSAALDYFRSAMTRSDPGRADRESRDAAADLVARAARLDRENFGGDHDNRQ